MNQTNNNHFNQMEYEEWIKQNPDLVHKTVKCPHCQETGLKFDQVHDCPHCFGVGKNFLEFYC